MLRATKNIGTLPHKPSTSPKFAKEKKTKPLRRCCTRSFTSVGPSGVRSKYLPAPSTESLFPRRPLPVDFTVPNETFKPVVVPAHLRAWDLWLKLGNTFPHPVVIASFPHMTTPAINFVAVCANANLPVNGTKPTYLDERQR